MSVEAADSAAAVVGAQKCTWGPAYWCSHVDNAKECKVSECLTFSDLMHLTNKIFTDCRILR